MTIDKDVLAAEEAAVNWDSGYLRLVDVLAVLDVFGRAAGGRFAGADLLGDWSPVRTAGWARRLLDLGEHPAVRVQAADAATRNGRANRAHGGPVRVGGRPRQAAAWSWRSVGEPGRRTTRVRARKASNNPAISSPVWLAFTWMRSTPARYGTAGNRTDWT